MGNNFHHNFLFKMPPKKGKKGKNAKDDWDDNEAEKQLEEKMKNLMKVEAGDEDENKVVNQPKAKKGQKKKKGFVIQDSESDKDSDEESEEEKPKKKSGKVKNDKKASKKT